ncbi:MAG: 2-amino-4-hydroxy-6-hydroxymethyldihydropteridine diphosphokinase [Ignavibacteria bacterium]|jgi:2-amino-4-hydroxy-6-hydroxymethyldihydropteridine diphosphokinase
MENKAFLGLGSNVGNREEYLRKAVEKLDSSGKIEIEKFSSVYETKPYGNPDQNNFLNAVVKIKTGFNIVELFNFIKNIEKQLKRTYSEKWGPREIDLDLLLFNDVVYKDDLLEVPHKEIEKRDFVLIPLLEIENNIVNPVTKSFYNKVKLDLIEKNILNKITLKLN